MRLLDDSGVDFTPFTIPIVLESKEEAERLYALFNYHPVNRWLGTDGCGGLAEAIRNRIQAHVGCSRLERHSEICEALG